MRLSELKNGESAVIVKVLGYGAFRKRVIEMGFVRGEKIKALMSAPLGDPVKYVVMGYEVALRRNETNFIVIEPINDANEVDNDNITNTITDLAKNVFQPSVEENLDEETPQTKQVTIDKSNVINVALVGNPNSGKTTMFNFVSGAKERVGNYGGVTVDSKSGIFKYGGYTINIMDLPGTYSLSCYSPEELYVRKYLKEESPDVVINVADASNLERNMYLTTELIDMDYSMVIALNMYDELTNSGCKLDYENLGKMIGVPIVPTVSRTGEGIDHLFETVVAVYEGRDKTVRHIHVNLGNEIESGITGIKNVIKQEKNIEPHFSPRYLAIKFLEKDKEVESQLQGTPDYDDLKSLRDEESKRIEDLYGEDMTSLIANEKYGFIAGALAETLQKNEKVGITTTNIIDTIVTNKFLGFPIFILAMFVTFWVTFDIGEYPMDWIDNGVEWLKSLVCDVMVDGPLKDLLVDGIISGVGAVIVFLPNILILYLFISFMEDSGYLARAAFIMDRLMHKIGLHGKSFISLLMGFGCGVPAIMSSRLIESRSSRLITILITPFISCTARLPIYVLFIGAFFSAHAALVMSFIYFTSIAIAALSACVLRKFSFKVDETPFVMELPPYRMPTAKATFRHMWNKGEQYLKKMGSIILVASIIVWALNYFPIHDEEKVQENVAQSTFVDDSAIDPSSDSYLEMIGKTINPIMEPLGFHWKSSVAAIAGLPAKEVVVSTLGVLYADVKDIEEDEYSILSEKLQTPSPMTGKPDFTASTALAFMIFTLLCCPCLATIVAVAKESGHWKYGLFTMVYNTIVAWIVAFIVYHIALLF